MRASANEIIAGLEARRLRTLFRYLLDHDFSEGIIADRLGLSPSGARSALSQLHEDEWIEEAEVGDGGGYRVTAKGRSLALASFSAPLKRSTAERKIRELLERIRLVNRDPYYLYAVVRVLLFGSMLGESNRVGDVDLVIDLESKVEDREGREAEERARVQAALDSGRRFSTLLEALSWPRDEVFLCLKSRSRGLSFHTSDDQVLKGITTKRLFP